MRLIKALGLQVLCCLCCCWRRWCAATATALPLYCATYKCVLCINMRCMVHASTSRGYWISIFAKPYCLSTPRLNFNWFLSFVYARDSVPRSEGQRFYTSPPNERVGLFVFSIPPIDIVYARIMYVFSSPDRQANWIESFVVIYFSFALDRH